MVREDLSPQSEQGVPLLLGVVAAKKKLNRINREYEKFVDQNGIASSMQFCEGRIADLLLLMITRRNNPQDAKRIAASVEEEFKGESIQDSKHLKFFKDTLKLLRNK